MLVYKIFKTLLYAGLCFSLLAIQVSPGATKSQHPEMQAGVVGDGTPASCNEAALEAALAGGGTVTFQCGGAATIVLTSAKPITKDTTILGGDEITLNGPTTRLFQVNNGATLHLQHIMLDGAHIDGSDGAAISNNGTLLLDYVTIRAGSTDDNHSGGAISTTGPATIRNSQFSNNTGGSGGAIFANFGNARVTIQNSQFVGNQATNTTTGYGGAIWVGENAQLTIEDSAFVINQARYGGAIYVSPHATLLLEGIQTEPISQMQLNGNSASQDGGAIYNQGDLTLRNTLLTVNKVPTATVAVGYGGAIWSSAMLTATNTLLSQNEGRFGGGIFVGGGAGGARASLERMTFRRNTGGSIGGGLYTNSDTAAITIMNSTFDRNTAVTGGGMGRFNSSVSITNTSFTENSASDSAGGLWVGAQQNVNTNWVYLTSVTLSGNTAGSGQGGGLYNQGWAQLLNVTVKNNTNGIFNFGSNEQLRIRNSVMDNPNSLNCDGDGTTPSNDGFNFVTDQSCGIGFTVVADLKLGPLQSDPGGTSFHLPLEGSPAINAATSQPGNYSCPPRDQRGALRPDACDSGAVEYGGLLPRAFLPLTVK